MKNKNSAFTLIVSLVLFPVILHGQTPITGIAYTYDAAGNRIHRAPATSSERKANPNASNEEKPKMAEVVTQNNIVASFTPNPTTTGNFAVVVSNNDLPTSDKNANAEKPQIFIYNPLGELIHQESTQYNTRANIDLSKYAKGIYIVKVQNGEDMLMHRMAYQ